MRRSYAKRVLIFSLFYYPDFASGAEIAIKEITDRVAPADIHFDMVTLRVGTHLPKRERIGNVDVYRIGPAFLKPTHEKLVRFPMYLIKVLYVPLAVLTAIRLDKERRYDALWSVMTYMGFPAVLFRMFRRKISYLLTLQDGDPIEHIRDRKRIRLVSFLFKKIFTECDLVQVISTYLGDFAKEMGARSVVVVPNGADIATFGHDMSPERRMVIREELGIKKGYTILVTSSRLVKKNGIDTIIEALAFLPKSCVAVVAGQGPELSTLLELAEEIDVKDRILFVGQLSHAELAVLFSASDVFVRPSRSEGFGSSFIEAMAAGLPVVATSVGGIADFLHDPKSKLGKVTPTGLFCNVDDPGSLAKKVQYYRRNEEFREKVMRNGKNLVEEKYSWTTIGMHMRDKVFRKLLV